MNNCELVNKFLPDYVIGVGSSDQRNLVERHIDECESCARELQALLTTGDLLNAVRLEPAPDLWESIEPNLKPRPRPMWTWLGRYRLQSAAAGVTAFIALAVLLFTGTEPLNDHDAAYMMDHASMSWREPFADKAALGLAGAIPVEYTEDSW